MKKLLLVMLVPLIVLGIIACSNTNVTGTDVDAFAQGAWVIQATWFEGEAVTIPTPLYYGLAASVPLGGFELAISGGQMTVRNGYTGVTYPFRVEYDYTVTTDSAGRFVAYADATADAGDATPNASTVLNGLGWPSKAGTISGDDAKTDMTASEPGLLIDIGTPTNILVGTITMYAYADDVEIALLYIIASQTAYGERQLTIVDVELTVEDEDYWKYDPHSIPLPGIYRNNYTATPFVEEE
jgi:hypothetical protein